ncbi:MAG: glycosyltransferase [Flavobacteriaceae bacterium]|nr:glycosyltransferase [Flavobacteriaceae bacterium]
MITKEISFIIPVFNRPEEIRELLQSFCQLEGDKDFEIVIIEDGSTIPSEKEVGEFSDRLNISYYTKPNSGPGDSRNFGMRHAKGDYFIILDSDCLLPPNYLVEVIDELNGEFVHCFGGPDTAHESFSSIQKAINFSMTSWLTTGGIRGRRSQIHKFQPRSFNMGLSKEAFKASGGFGKIHPGEDPDLSIRLVDLGYNTRLFPDAFVYHKRRISWGKFFKQVYKFGMVRVILNRWHPGSKRLFYWFPTVFTLGLILAILLMFVGYFELLYFYGLYFLLIFLVSWSLNRSIVVGISSVFAVIVQFLGYGYGFLRSQLKLFHSKLPEDQLFPELFFK